MLPSSPNLSMLATFGPLVGLQICRLMKDSPCSSEGVENSRKRRRFLSTLLVFNSSARHGTATCASRGMEPGTLKAPSRSWSPPFREGKTTRTNWKGSKDFNAKDESRINGLIVAAYNDTEKQRDVLLFAKRLSLIVETEGKSFTDVNCVTAMHRLAKTWKMAGASGEHREQIRPLFERCSELAIQVFRKATHREIPMFVWACATVGIVPGDGALLEGCAEASTTMMEHFQPQSISNLMWGLGTLAFTPREMDRMMEALERRTRDCIDGFTTQATANVMWSLARLAPSPSAPYVKPLMDLLCRRAMATLGQFKALEISSFMWGLATLGGYPGSDGTALLDAFSRQSVAIMHSAESQNVANTMWGFATLSHYPGAAFFESAAAFIERNEHVLLNPQEVASMAWTFAVLSYTPPASTLAVLRRALLRLAPLGTPQTAGLAIWSLAVMRCLTPDDLQQFALAAQATSTKHKMNSHDLTQLFHGLLYVLSTGADPTQFSQPIWQLAADTYVSAQAEMLITTQVQLQVAQVLESMGYNVSLEYNMGPVIVDIALTEYLDGRVAVEVDGPTHYSVNPPHVPLGRTVWRNYLLRSYGWKVVPIPTDTWSNVPPAERPAYLHSCIQREVAGQQERTGRRTPPRAALH